jgi:hypothetical protein
MKASILIRTIPENELKEIRSELKKASIPGAGKLLIYITDLKNKYDISTKEVFELSFYASHKS